MPIALRAAVRPAALTHIAVVGRRATTCAVRTFAHSRANDASPSVIYSSALLTDRKSTFQAHAAAIRSLEDAERIRAELVEAHPQLARSTHRMWALALVNPATGAERREQHDDDETGAGTRLAMLLQRMGAINVLVVVGRRFGGTQLGNDRFKHILNTARDALEQLMEQQKRDQQTQAAKRSTR